MRHTQLQPLPAAATGCSKVHDTMRASKQHGCAPPPCRDLEEAQQRFASCHCVCVCVCARPHSEYFLAFDWKSHLHAALLFSLLLLILPAPQATQWVPEAKGSFPNEQPTCCSAALPLCTLHLTTLLPLNPVCVCLCLCVCVSVCLFGACVRACVMLLRFCCGAGFSQEDLNEVDEAIDEIRFQVSRQVRRVGPFFQLLVCSIRKPAVD